MFIRAGPALNDRGGADLGGDCVTAHRRDLGGHCNAEFGKRLSHGDGRAEPSNPAAHQKHIAGDDTDESLFL